MDDNLLCETGAPFAGSFSCNAGLLAFSVASLDINGTEYQRSIILGLDPSEVSYSPLDSSSLQAIVKLTEEMVNSEVWLNVLLTGTASIGEIAAYFFDSGDGQTGFGLTVQHIYTSPGVYTASLQVTTDQGETATATSQITCDTPLPALDFKIEAGEVNIDQNWVRVILYNSYSQPIVVAGPPTSNDSEPVTIRIRNISPKGFKIRLDEWDYQDGSHSPETFSCEYDSSMESSFSGFRIYNNGQAICETTDPSARQLSCETATQKTANNFLIVAVELSGNETSPSNNIQYNP